MKLLLVFSAVLLSTATGKVMQVGDVTKVTTVQAPITASHGEQVAHVVEVKSAVLKDNQHEVITQHPVLVDHVTESHTVTVVPSILAVLPDTKAGDINVRRMRAVTAAPVPAVTPVEQRVSAVTSSNVQVIPKRQMRAVEEVAVPPTADVVASTSNPCDILCTKHEFNPVCATNGECLYEFANECVMETFNCNHPELGFKATEENKCLMHGLKRCTEKDLMG